MRYAFAFALTLAAAGALAPAAPPTEPAGPATSTGDSPLYLGLEPEAEAAPAALPEATPGKIPGGLVDAEWKRAFLPGENGQVEAIDLRTGKLLFASASRGQILALAGDHVYVLTATVDADSGDVQVRVLAMSITRQGKYVFASKPLPLPEWVAAGKSAYVTGTASTSEGKMSLHWVASGTDPANAANWRFRGKWGGMEANQSLSAAGDFSVDLATGEAKVIEPPAVPAAAPPAGAAPPVLMIGPGMISPVSPETEAPRWKPEGVSHGGLNYILSLKNNIDPVLTCYDPQNRRTLWQRTLDATPGAMPAPPGAKTVAVPMEEVQAFQGKRFARQQAVW
jgi:hypothetical protein